MKSRITCTFYIEPIVLRSQLVDTAQFSDRNLRPVGIEGEGLELGGEVHPRVLRVQTDPLPAEGRN